MATDQQNIILLYLQSYLMGTLTLTQEQVRIGPFVPTQMTVPYMVGIAQMHNTPELLDNEEERRHLGLAIYVALPVDLAQASAAALSVDATPADLQINAIYNQVHAALEAIREGAVNGSDQVIFSGLEESSGGVSYSVAPGEKIAIRYVISAWELTYIRALGGQS